MYRAFKRLMDLLFALVLTIILSPFFIVVMILLRLTGEGEVFYKQPRVGYKNQEFYIWKFATMLKNSPNMTGGSITVRNDPRVTPVGGFLRMTKLNELPQIFNVIAGDMSVVGPRPLMAEGFYRYSPELQAVVNNERPGITGIGSVVFRDEEKLITASTMDRLEFYAQHILPHKGALEVWYQNHISFMTDLKIIFLTAWAIIFPDNDLAEKLFPDLPKMKSDE